MDLGSYTEESDRPTGTVTFLFTDVVGSTPLWDRFPGLMAEALAVHDRLIQRAISDHGGHVFSTAGDSYAAAFATASAAISAGLTVQARLGREDRENPRQRMREHPLMARANLWEQMDGQPRRSAASLAGKDVPTRPGVYAWYRDGEAVYSGRALGGDGLHGRIWKSHLKTGNDLSRSSFRRNVCEHLGIAPTSRTTIRPTVMTAADIEPVNQWIRGCEVAWIECESPSQAETLERALHAEWMPPLSRR